MCYLLLSGLLKIKFHYHFFLDHAVSFPVMMLSPGDAIREVSCCVCFSLYVVAFNIEDVESHVNPTRIPFYLITHTCVISKGSLGNVDLGTEV